MCGIAGLVDSGARFGRAGLARIAAAMGERLRHRGPDDQGVWVAPDGLCALAHRRLAVVDPSPRGHQPMVTADGASGLSFNGEVYNFHALRRAAEARGWRFASHTDSEVVLALFASAEPDPLPTLTGMYAFAVWNGPGRRLLLARDAFGEKPLYWARGDGWLGFASELSALTAIPGFDQRVDPDAVAEYLMLQYVHAPRCIYRGARKLPPGAWTVFDFSAGARPRERAGRHFDFEPREPREPAPVDVAAAAEALRPVLIGAVERCLVSDVPLGAFLSGGIDSSLVVSILTRELGRRVKTFSIGFEGAPDSEHAMAREASAALGCEHHERRLRPDVVAWLPRIAAALDEPLGDTSCLPTYLLSELARTEVTVALSGDGGDELFGGYERYRETVREAEDWRLRLRFLWGMKRPWRPQRAYFSPRLLVMSPPQVRALTGRGPGGHAHELLADWMEQVADRGRPLVHRLRRVDVPTYLPGAVLAKVDRMSMAHALEVRAPLLDRAVAAFAADLPAHLVCHRGVTKPVLRALAGRYLPAAVAGRRKLGFGVPDQGWARAGLLGLCDEVLLCPEARISGVLDREALTNLVQAARRAQRFWINPLWSLLVLELWLRAQEVRG